jgi:hypothetical protein
MTVLGIEIIYIVWKKIHRLKTTKKTTLRWWVQWDIGISVWAGVETDGECCRAITRAVRALEHANIT